MKLSAKALMVSCAILWGACMLIVGLVHLIAPGYGSEFLRIMSSVYPGYHASPTIGGVIVGTIWGLIDGAICGFVVGFLYDVFLERMSRPMDRTV